MELIHKGERIVGAVAQQPFKYGNNTFCKLIPLFSHRNKYDKILNPDEFYNDGEIWWRVSSATNPKTLSPGLMLEFALEPSQESSAAVDKSLYQAVFTGKEEPIEPTAGAEIFTLTRETFKSIQRLKGAGDYIYLPHIPAKRIFLCVEGYVYGPFAATASVLEEGAVSGSFKVRASRMIESRPEICRMRMSDFSSCYHIARAESEVALDQAGRRLSGNLVKVSYEFLPPEECERIENDFLVSWERLDWEPLSAKLRRMSGLVAGFSRSSRRDFEHIVKKIDESAGASALPEEFRAMLDSVRKLAEDEETAFRDLAVSLMESDFMSSDTRFKKVTDEYLKRYVENHKKELEQELKDLDAKCEDAAKRVEEERKRLDRDREARKQEEKKAKDRLRQELEKERSQARKEIADERRRWNDEHGRMAADLDAKQKHVDAVLEEIKARGEKSAADCIALLPFLKELGVGAAQMVTVESSGPARAKAEPFVIPAVLSSPCAAAKTAVSENEFLTRLRDYANAQGLSYDLNDLRRFHVSVLCEGLSVLEGPSGVGKSSLARIYGEVLAGTDAAQPRDGTHIVHVSPSWVERADLLGYVNTVTGEFSPSESGLFQRLAFAQADWRSNAGGSAMYPICLDEMNLAQVEHYFSDFMQIMELPENRRILRCFSREAVAANAVFRDYASIAIPPTVRFVGTVNFDETTKRLSPRLLDRVNLIYLNDSLRARPQAASGSADAGKGVSAATYASWRKDGPLSANVEKRLADLADPLRKLGIIVSPRVRSAMARYIATSLPILGTGEKAENIAFDEQLAQRILSKVRTITSLAQKKALDAVCAAVDDLRGDAFSLSRSAIERLRAKEHFFGYESEA